MEKILRIYDLNRPDAPPREVDKSPGSIRTVAWLHSDQTILSSCTDMGGVRYGPYSLSLILIRVACSLNSHVQLNVSNRVMDLPYITPLHCR